MKTLLKSLALVAGVLVFSTGCDSFLDIDPKQELPKDRALNSFAKVEQAIAATYNPLATNDLYGENLMRNPELMADNLDLTQGGIPNDPYVNRNTNIFTGGNRATWAAAYRAIRNANEIIQAIDGGQVIEGASAAQRNQWKGECLAIRALMHFELVRLWGHPFSFNPTGSLGVPLRLKALSSDEALDRASRATVAEVYAAVISDLQAAIPLLPTTNGNGGRISTWAARAILARVYFNQNNYAAAYAQANDVITNSGITLNDTLEIEQYRNTGVVSPLGGIIWQINQENNPGISGATRPGSALPLGTGSGSLDQALTNLTNDVRATDTFRVVQGGFPFSAKYAPVFAFNLPIVRLAEVHLIRAEAGAQTGQDGPAQASLNAVRRIYYNGAGPFVGTTLTGMALVNAVRAERRIEMLLELGDRYHELRRTQQNVRGLAYNDRRLLLAIPDIEIGANPDMPQN